MEKIDEKVAVKEIFKCRSLTVELKIKLEENNRGNKLTKNNIFVFSTTAGVPGGAISGPLGGILRHHSTRHLSLLGS